MSVTNSANLPAWTLTADLQLYKALNNAVDEVRKEEWGKAEDSNKKALKGLRWLLYQHSSRRSKEDTQTLKSLHRGNRRIYRALVLKDEFECYPQTGIVREQLDLK